MKRYGRELMRIVSVSAAAAIGWITGCSALVDLDNVIASPHIGAATREAQARVGAEVAQKLIEFAKTVQPV